MKKSTLPDDIIRSRHFDMASFKRLLFAKVIPMFSDVCINHLKCFVIIVAIILFGSSLGYANNSANPTVQDIEHELQKSGPSGTGYWLINGFKFDEKTPWNFVMSQVALGKSEWIALVPKLDPGTDENTAYRFPSALAKALPRNPDAVLSVMVLDDSGHQDYAYLGPLAICNVLSFDDPEISRLSNIEILAYLKTAIDAVSKVKDPNLQKAKGMCLSELETINKYLKAPPTVQEVEHDIKILGVEQAISNLDIGGDSGRKTNWDYIMDQVEKGNAEWIALMPAFSKGVDGALAEEFDEILSDALIHNPEAVLPLIDENGELAYDQDTVCGEPFVEEPTDKEYTRHYQSIIKALSKVTDKKLQRVKNKCLITLKQYYKD